MKAAKLLPLVGLARSKQDPVNRENSAQLLFQAPPAGECYEAEQLVDRQ